ncbi:MAG: GGDEF domain-containing protein [Oscillospiraceae bacterium]|nr:GGDEF domain-containing protein [Oscillospiraceae bacterium]
MFTSERVTVFQLEQTHHYSTLSDLQTELQYDDAAPAGVVKVYRGILDPELSQESCLCFNIAHHNIEVFFDDVLVYSLTGAEGNRIGKNVSSNWCSVHVGQTHAGKTVTVVLTPLFEAAISKEPQFLLGSHYAIAMDVLTGELPLLVLSSLCVLLGLFVVAVSAYFNLVLKTGNGGILYLGFFSCAIGLWKLADLRCMPLLFPEASMAFGYISVASLFLTGLCLLMYFSTLFVQQKQKLPLLLSSGASLVCLCVLALQVLGIAEIRQNLIFSHGLLVASAVSVPLTAVFNRIVYKRWGIHRSWRLLLLLFVGIGLDLLFYYRNNGNGLMSFSIMGFIVYTLIVFIGSVLESSRKAYTDSRTGLENRTRWNELMNSDIALTEPYSILVVDLNGLKQVNDTLGHEAGDQMIFQLSSILRNTLPRNSVICRWGGDEFAALLTGVNRPMLDQQIQALLAAGAAYNADHPELPIHFAVGAALSAEHPGISRTDLFGLADEDMYRSKQEWYTRK